MPWVTMVLKSKDQGVGTATWNNMVGDLNYLKTQSEVLVAESGNAIKADVVPEAALKISNSPIEGGVLVSRNNTTGGLTWEELVNDPINSIQRGTISMNATDLTKTATITAVDTAKTQLNYLGASINTSTAGAAAIRISLTNNTTVTADREVHSSAAATVSFEVIEYN